MTRREVYDNPEWDDLRSRVLERDGNRCLLSWLLGGACSDCLHVHHIEPVEERPDLAFEEENLVTTCEHHHPMLEALRRAIRTARDRTGPRRCRHRHATRYGREACERALNA